MDISTVLMFLLGLVLTPIMVGVYIYHAERNNRRFKKAKAFMDKAGYATIVKTDPRIQEERIPSGEWSNWPYDSTKGWDYVEPTHSPNHKR